MRAAGRLLDGDAVAAQLRRQLAEERRACGLTPHMITVLVGEDPASESYIARKHADCAEIGLRASLLRLPATISQPELLAQIATLNDDPDVDGFFVQFPLPAHLDERVTAAAIAPQKDIDGLHPANLGCLLTGAEALAPCTPSGVLELLSHYGIGLGGKRVALIGRGPLVGRPLALMLSGKGVDAEVTILHRQSRDISAVLRQSEVIISAAGQPDLVRACDVAFGAVVVGVGISYDATGRMVSDIAADVGAVASAVTPPHGSVGALTRVMLLKNLMKAARGAARRG